MQSSQWAKMSNSNEYGTQNENSTLVGCNIEFEDFVTRNHSAISESIPNIEENGQFLSNNPCESEFFLSSRSASDSVDFSSCVSEFKPISLKIHEKGNCTDTLQGEDAQSRRLVESDPPIFGNEQHDEKAIPDLKLSCFKCKLCDARFKTKLQLEWHTSPDQNIQKSETFTCTICKQDFTSNHNSFFLHHLVFHAAEWANNIEQSEM